MNGRELFAAENLFTRSVATRNGRHDTDDIAVFYWCRFLGHVANVLIVQIHILETPELSVVSELVLAKLGKFCVQSTDRFAYDLRRNSCGSLSSSINP